MIALVFGWILVGIALVVLLGSLSVPLVTGGAVLASIGSACMFLGAALVGAGIVATRLDALMRTVAAAATARQAPLGGSAQPQSSASIPPVEFVPPGSHQYQPPPNSERNTGRVILLFFGLVIAAVTAVYVINPRLFDFDFIPQLPR